MTPPGARPYPVTAYAAASALGRDVDAMWAALRAGQGGLVPLHGDPDVPFATWYGRVPGTFAPVPPEVAAGDPACDTAQARLTWHLLAQILDDVRAAVARWGAHRVGVVFGTTTGGIADTEVQYRGFTPEGGFPAGYGLESHHVLHHGAEIIARAAGATGPRWGQSSACSSSTKVFGSARRLLDLGVCDAVVVGGVDTKCAFTLLGFHSLEVLSDARCRPFSATRQGINLGEGGGLVLLEREGTARALLHGVGETSDAFHMTQPRPDGAGLAAAIEAALRHSGVAPEQVDLVSAHATGTVYNDASEATALAATLPHRPPVVGSKGYTGHTLGACGALESVLCLKAIEVGWSPGTLTEGPIDPELDIDVRTEPVQGPFRYVLKLSAAFAGHNGAVLWGAP